MQKKEKYSFFLFFATLLFQKVFLTSFLIDSFHQNRFVQKLIKINTVVQKDDNSRTYYSL